MKIFAILLLAGFLGQSAAGAIKTETVEYKLGDVILEGYLAYDDAMAGKRPGVMVVHEWMGLGDYAKARAEQLAAMGYIAFAADIYGQGVRPKDTKEASEQASFYRSNRSILRARAKAGLEQLKNFRLTDSSKVAAIGYCFGGGTVLELARSGATFNGVVSFHGNLDTPNLSDAQNITAKVLVLHGAADPHVPSEQVAAFQKEMHDAKVDWQMISYGGAVHSFTNPASGTDPARGSAYNETADKRSWEAMKLFFGEIFR